MSSVLNAAFLGGLGLLGIHASRSILARQKTIAAWPTTQGRIVAKEVVRSPTKGFGFFRPTARYTYDVDGVTHEGDQISPLVADSRRRAQVQSVVDALPEVVTVHYNPQQPGEAYLTPGPTVWHRLTLGLCVVFVLVALLLLLAG